MLPADLPERTIDLRRAFLRAVLLGAAVSILPKAPLLERAALGLAAGVGCGALALGEMRAIRRVRRYRSLAALAALVFVACFAGTVGWHFQWKYTEAVVASGSLTAGFD